MFLSTQESSKEYAQEDSTANSGEMSANSVSVEEEHTVEDKEKEELGTNSEECIVQSKRAQLKCLPC